MEDKGLTQHVLISKLTFVREPSNFVILSLEQPKTLVIKIVRLLSQIKY